MQDFYHQQYCGLFGAKRRAPCLGELDGNAAGGRRAAQDQELLALKSLAAQKAAVIEGSYRDRIISVRGV